MKNRSLLIFTCLLAGLNTAFAAVDYSGWTSYGNSIANCKPGTFTLPDPIQAAFGKPVPDTITYQIVGMNAGACKVTITRAVPNPGEQPSLLTLNCLFAATNLPTLSKSAKDMGAGNFSTNDPASNIMSSSCKQAE